jgi:hypothetical protein
MLISEDPWEPFNVAEQESVRLSIPFCCSAALREQKENRYWWRN